MPRRAFSVILIVCLIVSLTLVSTITVDAQRSTKTLTAWGRIKIDAAGYKLPWGVPDNTTLTLESTSRSNVKYTARLKSGSDSVVNAFRTGVFEFKDVPAEGQPIAFSLCYTPPTGSEQCFNITYKFYYPGWPATAPRLKRAGYMGDFTIDLLSGKITRKDKPPLF